MCLCVYVFMCACVCACSHACAHECVRACVFACDYVCELLRAHPCVCALLHRQLTASDDARSLKEQTTAKASDQLIEKEAFKAVPLYVCQIMTGRLYRQPAPCSMRYHHVWENKRVCRLAGARLAAE